MQKHQIGTLHELSIIGLLLAIAGIMLASQHPAFLVLVIAGILLLNFQSILEWGFIFGHHAPAAKKRWKELCAQGFNSSVIVRARMSEGGALIAVDLEAGKVAFITSDDSQIMDIVNFKKIELINGTVSQWGKPTITRYSFHFVLQDNTDGFGLSYSSKNKAVKSFNKLRKVLDGRITFIEDDDG